MDGKLLALFFYKRYGINSMNLPDKRKKNIKKLHKLKREREKEKTKTIICTIKIFYKTRNA